MYPNAITVTESSGLDTLTMSDSVVPVADTISAPSQSPVDNSTCITDADAVNTLSTSSDGNRTNSSSEQPYNSIGTDLSDDQVEHFQHCYI